MVFDASTAASKVRNVSMKSAPAALQSASTCWMVFTLAPIPSLTER